MLTLAAANLLDLSSISVMGSAGFLLIFAVVNVANALLHRRTGASRAISIAGAVACLAALAALVWQRATEQPGELWVLAGMLAIAAAVEIVYRAATGRQIKTIHRRQQP